MKTVVFTSPESSFDKLRESLSLFEQANFVDLPPINSTPLEDHEVINCVISNQPEMVMIDVSRDYDYQALIEHLRRSIDQSVPFIGIMNSPPDKDNKDLLTSLPIDSYLFSDWSIERLQEKLQKLSNLKQHNASLQEQVQQSSSTAMTAMKAASEVGLLMQLVEWLNEAQSHEEIANCLFKLCNCLELKAFAMIHDAREEHLFPKGMVYESAERILKESHGYDIRVLSKQRVLIFRLEYLVLLVTNAPWQDEERYGRYRDILLQASALAEAKARTLTVNKLISEQHEKVSSIMLLIKNLSGDTQRYTKEIMQALSDDLAAAALTLDITEEQEDYLQKLSNEAYESIEVLHKNSDALEDHFHELINSITKVKDLTKATEKKLTEPDTFDDDISLF